MKPTDEEIQKKALEISENAITSLTTQQQVFFLAGFQTCAKWMREQIGDQWISVEEKLPQDSEMVLVHNGMYIDFGVYSDGWIMYFEHLRSVKNWEVKYWQPLPTPPINPKTEAK